jgi:hypothetical protein
LTLDDWITLKDHGVSTAFVTELKTLGYERLPLEDLRRMKDHGVSAAFIKELKDLGYTTPASNSWCASRITASAPATSNE